MKIKELDLHGLGHEYAKKVLTSWLKNNHVPYRIITGNSGTMEKIVREVFNSEKYRCEYERYHNLGELIVTRR